MWGTAKGSDQGAQVAQFGPEPAEEPAVAVEAGTSSGGTSAPGGPCPPAEPRPKRALTFCHWAEGERWIDSATAMIRATPLNISFSQLAPDTSCSPWTPTART